MTNSVNIKGIRDGLLITVDDRSENGVFDDLERELSEKQAFLQGSRIAVEVGRRNLAREELGRLRDLLDRHGLTLWAVLTENADTRQAARGLGFATRLAGSRTDLEGNALSQSPAQEPAAVPDKTLPEANALLLRETVRSGRSIYHEGHVVVVGDVNAGAEIVAGGNVVVWGRLRGLVHAGALGDTSAVICALELTPTQLRIADQIAMAPDDDRRNTIPEQAVIRDGRIVAESWLTRHGAGALSSAQ